MIERFIELETTAEGGDLLTDSDRTALLRNAYRTGVNRFKKFLERTADYQNPYIKDDVYDAVSLQVKNTDVLAEWGLPPDANVQIVLGNTPGLLDEDEELADYACEISVVHHEQDGKQHLLKFLPLRRFVHEGSDFDLIDDPQTVDKALAAQRVLLDMMGEQVEMLHFIEANVIPSNEIQ